LEEENQGKSNIVESECKEIKCSLEILHENDRNLRKVMENIESLESNNEMTLKEIKGSQKTMEKTSFAQEKFREDEVTVLKQIKAKMELNANQLNEIKTRLEDALNDHKLINQTLIIQSEEIKREMKIQGNAEKFNVTLGKVRNMIMEKMGELLKVQKFEEIERISGA
jgi:hypothetical protein